LPTDAGQEFTGHKLKEQTSISQQALFFPPDMHFFFMPRNALKPHTIEAQPFTIIEIFLWQILPPKLKKKNCVYGHVIHLRIHNQFEN